MNLSADEILREEERNEPKADNMLREAERLNEEGLGYPLNIMVSLYYESSSDEEPSHAPGDGNPASETRTIQGQAEIL